MGYVPGFPGAHSQGQTLDELNADLRDVIAPILDDGAAARLWPEGGERANIRSMAMMLSKTYEALKAAGSPDEKARDTAEEIAGYDNRLAKIEADLTPLKWMLGLNPAFSLTLIAKTSFA